MSKTDKELTAELAEMQEAFPLLKKCKVDKITNPLESI